MKDLIQAINRLAAAQEESNKICKLNIELLQSMFEMQKAQLKHSNYSICREDKDNNK